MSEQAPTRCPLCGPASDWTAIRRIFIDGVWRAYRKHRGCGTAVGLEARIMATAKN